MSPRVSLGPVGSVPPCAYVSSLVSWVEEEMFGVPVRWRWSWRGAEEEDGQRAALPARIYSSQESSRSEAYTLHELIGKYP